MKVLSPTLHGCLDYLTVAIFLAAPGLVPLKGLAATISYVLAGVHLVMTLLSDFPLGFTRSVPFSVHGIVERIVGPVLVLLPFVLGFDTAAHVFYILIGLVIIVVGLVTNYEQPI